MDEQKFKKLLDNALAPVKKDLGRFQKTLAEVKETLDEVKDTQDNRVLPSVTQTELTLKSYADQYKINQHNIERVDTRLSTVEENLGINPPEDLKVPHFSSK